MSDRPRSPRQPAAARAGFGKRPNQQPRSQPNKPASYKGAAKPLVPSSSAVDADADAPMRLSKRMAELGLASRREADEWIAQGWVLVDGQVVSTLGSKVTRHQRIEIAQPARVQQQQRITVLLNKPIGYVSGQPEDGYQAAIELIKPEHHWSEDTSPLRWQPHHLRGLAPAGRLDIDSTGLLILTQDGVIARQLIGAESNMEKEYLVRVEWPQAPSSAPLPEIFPAASLALLNHGLSLDGVVLRPAQVSWQNNEQLRFILRQGRKRQIRRMCEAVGLKVLALKRVRVGRMMLGSLPVGQWRYLKKDETFIE